MKKSSDTLNEKKLTWLKFSKWSFALYLISSVAVFIKINLQKEGELMFTNYSQFFVVPFIPLIFMLMVLPILLIGLAFNKFKIDKAKSVVFFTLTVYIAVFISRLFSIKPF